MALEDELRALAAALTRNSDLLEGLTAKAQSRSEKAPDKAAEKPPEEPAPKSRRSIDEPDDEPAPKKRTTAPKAEPKKKPITDAQMVDIVNAFGDVKEDDEYEARRDFIKKVVAKFGVKSMRLIPEADRQKAVDWLEAFKAGEDPLADEE